jgi:glutaredoxin-related protein
MNELEYHELCLEKTSRKDTNKQAKDIIKMRNIKYDILFTVPDTVTKSKNLKRYTELISSFSEKADKFRDGLIGILPLISSDDNFDTEVETMIASYRRTDGYVTDIIESMKSIDEKIRLLEIKLEGSFNNQYASFMKKLDAKKKANLDELRRNSFSQ